MYKETRVIKKRGGEDITASFTFYILAKANKVKTNSDFVSHFKALCDLIYPETKTD